MDVDERLDDGTLHRDNTPHELFNDSNVGDVVTAGSERVDRRVGCLRNLHRPSYKTYILHDAAQCVTAQRSARNLCAGDS